MKNLNKQVQRVMISTASIPFPDEITHLIQIEDKLDNALKKAKDSVERIDKEYIDTKRYMVEYRGEIDPHEMFQTELLLKQTDHTGAFAVEIRDKLAKLKDSPYFARIDFKDDEEEPIKLYIGRFSFSYENEILIFDWRAPVASMFYDYELGLAGYDAPAGRINGILTLKRQFKIKNGVMEYALESSSHVKDDILQKELSHTSDEKMKSIISTIQKEQNQIIRNEKGGTLIIQGVAGSGKTSIALHRIAFLLYRFKDKINSKNVTILSPNKVFGDYISGVIPELGEEPIYELSFEDIVNIQLERVIDFQMSRDSLEINDEEWAQRVRFKSTIHFLQLLDEYLKQLPNMIFSSEDYVYESFVAKSEWITKRFHAYSNYPIKQRLNMVAEDIYYKFESDNYMDDALPTIRVITNSLAGMLKFKTTLALYKDFYNKIGKPELFVIPVKKTLEWMDVFPFLYVHHKFEGLKISQITKHLVIDEMQDYTPIQYAVMNLLFPCKKTILGDFGQSMNPNACYTLSDLKSLYEGAEFVELNKSYRSTYEIMTFAKKIQQVSSLEPVERHGDIPIVLSYLNQQEEVQSIIKLMDEFENNEYASLGIIFKTNKIAKKEFELLSHYKKVNLITPESTTFQNGITITSIQMSKGLEFDQVIVPQANKETYVTDYDRKLLYIACTRSMHKLTLLYSGECSPLIPLEEFEK